MRYGSPVLFMIVERFHGADPAPVGERFKSHGRMLPNDVVYHASWIEPSGSRCFQLMETVRPESLTEWISRWKDIADFEVIPVLTSAAFWEKHDDG